MKAKEAVEILERDIIDAEDYGKITAYGIAIKAIENEIDSIPVFIDGKVFFAPKEVAVLLSHYAYEAAEWYAAEGYEASSANAMELARQIGEVIDFLDLVNKMEKGGGNADEIH